MTGFGTIPNVTTPFGITDVNMRYPIGYRNGYLYKDVSEGLSVVYSAPGGKPLTRHHMNSIGFLATIGGFLQQCGYQPGFDTPPAGGWPKGAIVTDVSGGLVREYLCTEDESAAPVIGTAEDNEQAVESGNWTPVWSEDKFGFFPDFDNKTTLFSKTIEANGTLAETKIEGSSRGWILITRTYDDWDSLSDDDRLFLSVHSYPLNIKILSPINEYTIEEDSIKSYEGGKASRLIPCNGTITLSMQPLPSNYGTTTIKVDKFDMEEV